MSYHYACAKCTGPVTSNHGKYKADGDRDARECTGLGTWSCKRCGPAKVKRTQRHEKHEAEQEVA